MHHASEHIYHALDKDELIKLLESDSDNGLSPEEAKVRIEKYGQNTIEEAKKRSIIWIFLSQFKNPIVYLLIFATGLSFYFQEWLDAIAIIIVIFVNALIGFYMELQAERSMDALKKLTAIPVKILRSGEVSEYDSVEIVPGDILYAEAGDMISADARILEGTQVQADESALTGESVPVEKKDDILPAETPLAERVNMLYKGTHISRGNVWAIVTGTGMKTELGEIASLVDSAEQSTTPLEKKLENFSKKLILITLGLVVVIFISGLLNGKALLDMLGTSIALAVAAIPEGLPIVATLALAQGMLKMAKYQVIVKKLSAVETLGSTTVICTDKTGTLTENKIRVSNVVAEELEWKEGDDNISEGPFEQMKLIAILCNTSELKQDGDKVHEVGDPLETGLLKFAAELGEDIASIREKHAKVKEEPFSSETKMMVTMHRSGNELTAYAKGAAEALIEHSTHILIGKTTETFDETRKQHWLEQAEKLAASGLRMIAGASKTCQSEGEEELSSGLTFVGLFGMMDPLRKDVHQSIEECKAAGIRVMMITGDHPSTAKNIGNQLGIAEKDEEVIIGSEMKAYDSLDESAKAAWTKASIFARVSPKQKLELVKVLQEEGNVVAMTGDGVNDAPALKKADIGIAMGLRGTQVAQEVADMILKDDSFKSIATAIKQGRIIFENIRKFVIFLLSCNLSELLVIAVASVFSLHFQLFPLQILFINLITDVLPALALGVTEGSDAIMKQKPKSMEEPVIDAKRWWTIIFYSIVLGFTSVSGVMFSHYAMHGNEEWNPELGNNILFFSLIFSQLLHVLNMGKTGSNYFSSEVFKNRYVWIAIITSLAIVLGLSMLAPVRQALSLHPMSVADWLIAVISAIASVIIIQTAKMFKLVRQ